MAISDGDTITVLNQGTQQKAKIRLYGIDCPEMKQAHGPQAKALTAALVADQAVEIKAIETDRFGRTVARVHLPDGDELSAILVRGGLAWVYRKYCKAAACQDWLEAERTARINGLGLWSSMEAVPPWEWRRGAR